MAAPTSTRVGCVAYYLLTGQLVFEAVNALQMVAKHMNEAPIPPSKRTELHVPARLEELVLACLAKQPEDRPASAGELSRSLAAVGGEVWGEEQAARWWAVNRPGLTRGNGEREPKVPRTEYRVPSTTATE